MGTWDLFVASSSGGRRCWGGSGKYWRLWECFHSSPCPSLLSPGVLFAFLGWLGRTLALGVGIVPLSLGCPSHQPWSTNVCYREVLLSGQVVAVGKSLDLFLLTLSVAMLSCSPQGPWESESRGSWVQAALGRTQHQRCFPRVILPRNQGNFMSLSSPQCCNSVFMTHQFFLHFCHWFPSGWPSSFPVPSNASCSAGPLQRWWRCSPAVLGCFP